MESNEVASADQLPDRNYIERLFPKCQPKSEKFSRSRTGQMTKSNRRNRKIHRRTKNQLHARRDISRSQHKNKNLTSESSDDSKKTSKTPLKLTGKYVASQSLQQQLQRSQSSYSTNKINQSLSIKTVETQDVTKKDEKHSVQVNKQVACRGIVKSNSSFAFLEASSGSPKEENPNQARDSFRRKDTQDSSPISTQVTVDLTYNEDVAACETIASESTQKHKQQNSSNSTLKRTADFEVSENSLSLSLRHLKLPNETSHYSIIRTNDDRLNENCNNDYESAQNVTSNMSNNNQESPPRFSSIQFNSLSDDDSGPEENNGNNYTMAKRVCDSANLISSSNNRGSLPGVCSKIENDDDMTPTTKTALIFPRLDEGLSSEAESGDDEVEEDDDRAIEADDDEGDEGDEVDEVDEDDDRLTGTNDMSSSHPNESQSVANFNSKQQNSNFREVLIEGVLFNVKYLGSTHTDCEGRGEKEDRIQQAEMAVHEVKLRNGDSNVATEVQLFISTEKIMVLDDKHRKLLMDHSLRTISYIADIGDAIVLIVRKKNTSSDIANDLGRPISRISCHVFESSESHTITKSISQAFQVAYTELLKANGTGDTSSYLPKELDYQEVLNSQEMSTDELEMFARKENQREVIVPKQKNEILGIGIVESGWGSVLPTVVIASLKHDTPAYKCKKLSVGDQILSINGISLVGLPLAECQEILRKTKSQSVARLTVVPCPITVEVKIKRPDTKYQLGFSVQNGVICSLLRGGIAERGGVRVGHRIMSINGTTVVGVPHDKIVTLLASSVGEIRMKTCLTSLYRLILGEENPVHF